MRNRSGKSVASSGKSKNVERNRPRYRFPRGIARVTLFEQVSTPELSSIKSGKIANLVRNVRELGNVELVTTLAVLQISMSPVFLYFLLNRF